MSVILVRPGVHAESVKTFVLDFNTKSKEFYITKVISQ